MVNPGDILRVNLVEKVDKEWEEVSANNLTMNSKLVTKVKEYKDKETDSSGGTDTPIIEPETTVTVITNFTANPIRRLDLEFQASYDDKIDKVKKVINEVLDNCEYVLEDKTRLVNVVKHGDSSVVYIVQVWVKKENYLPAKYNLNEAVKEAFDKNKIEIPYMQIDIRNR